MERRTLIAITLCIGVIMAWQKYYIEPHIAQVPTQNAAAVVSRPSVESPVQSAGASLGKVAAPIKSTPENSQEKPEFKTNSLLASTITFSNGHSLISDWKLKNYRKAISQEAPPVDLQSVTHQDGVLNVTIEGDDFQYLNDVRGHFLKDNDPNRLTWNYDDSLVRVERVITYNANQPYFDLAFKAEFKTTKKPAFLLVSVNASSFEKDPEAQDRQLLYFTEHSISRVQIGATIDRKEVLTPVKFIAANSRYFLLTALAQGGDPKALIQGVGPHQGKISLVYNVPTSNNAVSIPLRIYFGPKDLPILRSVDPALDTTVDFGWFTVFAYPLLKLLRVLYTFFGNYGVAIIILTLLLKIVTYPLTLKSMKGAKEMAKIQPQLTRIKEKYKDDPQALNKEMLTVMKSHGYNPLAGCLPILVTMPVFFALYRVLYGSIELFQAPFYGWIHDLSAPDPFYITPVLMTFSMFIQQKLTPTPPNTDPAQAKMLQLMPLMFGAMMLWLPSGLTLYMLVNALVSIIQQNLINKKLGMGRYVPTAVAQAQ